ncbi:MAG: TssN family type VI secretion system protein [Bacteroidales bacterium]|jgi:hypothetical protein|nr:TssN family type VI secretion system protein [Bacteroidales bacterium]
MISNVLVLFSICVILSAIFFAVYRAKVKESGKKKWLVMLYLASGGVLIGLVGLLGFIDFVNLKVWTFIAAQGWLLTIGIFHAWLLEKLIPLDDKNAGRIIFTIALCFFGYALIVMPFAFYFKTAFPLYYFMPAFFFLAPTFVYIAFSKFIEIPLKVFKTWKFPSPGTLPDPSDSEMADPIIVNFEISKQCAEKRTVFKAKAPKGMNLGKLFYFFIMDYNSRHSDNPIMITDSNNKTFGWSFYLTPSIIHGRTHLDPEVSVSGNRIKENASVICERTNQ